MEKAAGKKPHGDKRAKSKKKGPKCGAPKRQGDRSPCGNPAGFKTNHRGIGRCHLHGGNTPIKHGLYSSVVREQNQALVEQLAKSPDLTSLDKEIALVRVLLHEFAERTKEAMEKMAEGDRVGAELVRIEGMGLQIERLSQIIVRKMQIETAQATKLTPAVISGVINIIGGILVECFSPNADQLARFQAKIRARFALGGAGLVA